MDIRPEEIDVRVDVASPNFNLVMQRNLELIRELLMTGRDFFFDVAAGKLDGYAARNVVGHSANITTTLSTVWARGGLYTYSTAQIIDSISSDDVTDTHEITIAGLDIAWNEIIVVVTLNGQTRVALPTALFRVNQIWNATAIPTAGTIYVYENTALSVGVPIDSTKTRAVIDRLNGVSNEVSTSSVVSIPAGKTGFLVFGKTSATDTKAIEFTFWARAAGGVFINAHHVDFKDNNYDYFFKLPGVVQEKTDLEARATVDVGTAEVNANFDLILKDIAA